MTTIANAETKDLKSAPHRVLAVYKFLERKLPPNDLKDLQAELQDICLEYGAKGTLLLAQEGINGTICYPYSDESNEEDPMLNCLRTQFGQDLRTRISQANFNVFPRMKVKVKTEIVSLHQQDCCPTESKGVYVKPGKWNELLNDPDCLVVDTRNEYEIHVGTFRNSLNPHTQNFVEFPDWMEEHLAGDRAPKKIAMFCTGGIRCEKATNVCQKLVPEDVPVYHLEGGILAYLDEIKPEESMFVGDCYVFDQRVAVTYGNRPSTKFTDSCKACRHPLSKDDMESQAYVEGLSCSWCVDKLTEKQRERFASRQRQVQIARDRGVEEFFDPEQMKKKRD